MRQHSVSTGWRYVPHSRSYTRCLRPAIKDKCYADKPETIDAVKNDIREAIGEIQLHTIDNVLKNWTDCVGYCMPSRKSHLNEIIIINLRKYSVVSF